MQCPTDGATLLMTDRQGVEIDYCPTCRGVWLDRGELDKIVERAGRELAAADGDDRRDVPPPPPPPPPAPSYRRPYEYDRPRYEYLQKYDYRSRHYDPRYRKKKNRSFLYYIFDFY